MDKLMQTLFSYIEENLEDTEELRKQCIAREELENRLRDTLTEAQSALLEDLIRLLRPGGLPPAPPGQKLSCSIAPNPPGTLKPKC